MEGLSLQPRLQVASGAVQHQHRGGGPGARARPARSTLGNRARAQADAVLIHCLSALGYLQAHAASAEENTRPHQLLLQQGGWVLPFPCKRLLGHGRAGPLGLSPLASGLPK